MEFKGLNDKEVEASREKYGSNTIPDSEPALKKTKNKHFPIDIFRIRGYTVSINSKEAARLYGKSAVSLFL